MLTSSKTSPRHITLSPRGARPNREFTGRAWDRGAYPHIGRPRHNEGGVLVFAGFSRQKRGPPTSTTGPSNNLVRPIFSILVAVAVLAVAACSPQVKAPAAPTQARLASAHLTVAQLQKLAGGA